MRAKIKVLTSALWSGNREHCGGPERTVRLKLGRAIYPFPLLQFNPRICFTYLRKRIILNLRLK